MIVSMQEQTTDLKDFFCTSMLYFVKNQAEKASTHKKKFKK